MAAGLTEALTSVQTTHFAAVTLPDNIGQLLRDIDAYVGYTFVVYYLKILPYVFTRPSELRLAHWSEFDCKNAIWIIPASRMKMRREHVVPLSKKETMTLHGFRAMASTRLNELGFRADVIEAQPAHKEPDTVRLAYNRAEYMEERRQLMQKWANYLDELRSTKQ